MRPATALPSLVLLATAALSGCGGGDEADIPAIEKEVAAGIKDQLGVRVTVDCPDKITWKAGGEFHCFAEDRQGASTRVTISMENDDGEWSWATG